MSAKPQNLLRSLLVIPYFTWGIALLIVYLVSISSENTYTTNAFFEAIAGVAAFYTIGIILWGIPYTILVLGLLLWSFKKPAPIIYKVFVTSPLLLSILTGIEIILISYWPPQPLLPDGLTGILSSIFVAVVPILVFGYSFVGMGIIIYKALNRLNLIRANGEA